MATTTYSFSDVKIVLQFPGYPSYTVNGQGTGDISITYANDNSAHNLAADGSVMVSRIRAENGAMSLNVQQTSPLHNWLKGVFNYLNNPQTASALWASGVVTVSSPNGGFENINLTGVSFTKRADQPYQQQGQMVTWNFMYANGQTVGTTIANTFQNVAGNIVNNNI